MPNPENIVEHSFKPGESGNINGRPKGTQNSATRLRRLLELTQKKKNPVTGEMEEFTVLEQMDMAVIAKAIKGNLAEYKEILDRLEGKAKQSFDMNGNLIINWNEQLTDDPESKTE